MTPFLEQIAQVYASNVEADDMLDFCFVFPNKRGGVFFAHYLDKYRDQIALQPAITTISQMLLDLTDGVEASRMEQLMVLYAAYREILTEQKRQHEAVDFDRFIYWGDVIINDFNDVDRYLVEPDKIFRNIRELKDIQSTYLTPEQIAVIQEFWGDKIEVENIDAFWQHVPHNDDETGSKFLRLWHIMQPLYKRFNLRLSELGLTYSGRTYRQAVKTIKEIESDQLPYRRYIFVGFNALTTAETRIFEILQQRGRADFYWDTASPAFAKASNKATRFLRNYTRHFQSLYPLPENKISEFGEINIEGIPSNIGQTKRAGEIVGEIAKTDKELGDSDAAMRTAIIIPDSNLLIPMLHSIPQEIEKVNITMGIPMRSTPIASLVRSIITMQIKAQKLHGEMTVFYNHVYTVLAHPMLRATFPTECAEIVDYINKTRLFNLSTAYVIERWPTMEPLFTPVKDSNSPQEVYSYADRLMRWLLDAAQKQSSDRVAIGYIQRYIESIATMRYLTERYDVTMNENTFFHLLERLMANESVNFTGEPLCGLQVMGMLETRALDFDNVIILSMNERIYPSRHYAPTFIPNALRRGFGMATIEFQESIFSYYFYRLITRARKTYLLYDTRQSGVKSGEMSRYLTQLRLLYKSEKLSVVTRSYDMTSSESRTIEIPKSEKDMEIINRYLDPESGQYLSPSTIDHYVQCPLQYYFEYIKGYRVDNPVANYLDEGTYGTIVHEVAQQLYENLRQPDQAEVYITQSDIDNILSSPITIDREITRAINRHFYNKKDDHLNESLSGQAKIHAHFIKIFIRRMLEREKTPFYFVGGEQRHFGKIELSDGRQAHLKCYIDRIDRLPDGSVRIIDYKTGSDPLEISDWEKAFAHDRNDHQKAIMQLMLYCNIYAQSAQYDGKIQPLIYKFREIANHDITPLQFGNQKIGKKEILDYRDFNDDYMPQLRRCLDELFDPTVPFRPSSEKRACKYCAFTKICDREE